MTPARAARPLAAEDLAAALDVSRETLDRLRIHRDLLLEWQASLGLVGRSTLVGKPLALLLGQKAEGANATVTLAHTGTSDLGAVTREAEILVVAAGRLNTVTAEMVRPGAVVIDVGTNRVDDATRKRGWRLAGDVDFEGVSQVASAITPVPGGVGPMTIAMLLVNTLRAAGVA